MTDHRFPKLGGHRALGLCHNGSKPAKDTPKDETRRDNTVIDPPKDDTRKDRPRDDTRDPPYTPPAKPTIIELCRLKLPNDASLGTTWHLARRLGEADLRPDKRSAFYRL